MAAAVAEHDSKSPDDILLSYAKAIFRQRRVAGKRLPLTIVEPIKREDRQRLHVYDDASSAGELWRHAPIYADIELNAVEIQQHVDWTKGLNRNI